MQQIHILCNHNDIVLDINYHFYHSLYDVHYSILRQYLSLPILDMEHKVKLQPLRTLYEPWKEYTPSQPDPRVLYVISTGTLGRMTYPEFFDFVDDLIKSKVEVVNLLHGTAFKFMVESDMK